MSIRLEERSIYPYIVNFLKESFGLNAISEAKIDGYRADIVFNIDSDVFIMEIKLGDHPLKLSRAISQVYNYAEKIKTRNILALVFPNLKSNQVILKDYLDKLEEYIVSQVVEGYIHTEYWEKWISREEKRSLKNVLEELYKRHKQREREIDLNSIIKAIREIIQDLHDVIRQSKTEEIFEEVAKKLELFTSIGEIRDIEEAKRQVNILASYLLFNQLLFYHVYKIKTKDKRLPDLKPIKSISDLKDYFSKITEIDYQPIFSVNIIDKIPDKSETIELINEVIKNLNFIRVEHVTHDLAGRFFHALLPREVAKVWAAFYTHPIAAEILARLAIERWYEAVIDPACGSGTLLAAAYRRKTHLYEMETKRKLTEKEFGSLHKRFLEEDLTGIDIMPFAAHLAAINLVLQKLEEVTDVVRISVMDSLTIAPRLISKEFVERGIIIESFSRKIQKSLNNHSIIIETKGSVSPKGSGKEFRLKPVDVVIMNPPFSDRDKLPDYYRSKLSDNTDFGKILGKYCGHRVDLWGYFLALADLLLKPGGKIAAVIPINIARGKATEKIRKYILNNYHIRYIIKPATQDFAFSESSKFKDILLIAEKKRPNHNDNTIIINLKKSIREMNFNDVEKLVEEIKNPFIMNSDLIEKKVVSYKELIASQDNLMTLLGGVSFMRREIILEFLEKIKDRNKNRIKKFEEEYLKMGFAMPTDNFSKVIFLTRETEKDRVKKAFLILRSELDNKIVISIKNNRKNYVLNKEDLVPAIRTITSIRYIDVTRLHDYILIKNHEKINELNIFISKNKKISEYLKDLDRNIFKHQTNIAIATRVGLSSPNTSLLCVFSEIPLVPLNAFFFYENPKYTKEDYKILTLFLNSIIHIAQFIALKKETTGDYHEIMKEDLKLMMVMDPTTLTKEEKDKLLVLFEKIKTVRFPSIIEQLEKRFWARIELDKAILEVLGFSESEINNLLFKIYDIIVNELKQEYNTSNS